VDIWTDPVNGLPVAVQVFARGSSRAVVTSSFLQLSESRPALSAVTPNPAPGVGITAADLPDVADILSGIGPTLPGRFAGLPRSQIRDGFTWIGVYGTGFSRFAVIPLPGHVGDQALSTALAAGAEQIESPDGTVVMIHTPLVTVALASSRYGGPVFLLAGPVTGVLLEKAAAQVLRRPLSVP